MGDLISIDDRNIPLVNQCEENYSENSEDHSGEEATNQFGMNVFFTGSYQLMLWSFAFTWSVAFAVIFSVKTFVLSLEIDFSLFTLDTIGALLMLVSNLVMPALSDLLLERIIPRTIWCLIFVTMQTVFTFFSVWYGSMLSIFITYILVMFLSNATNMSIIPAIINDFFGAKHFSRNYGFIFMLGGLFNLAVNIMIGSFYDLELGEDGRHCYGLKCFIIFFIISFAMGCISFFL